MGVIIFLSKKARINFCRNFQDRPPLFSYYLDDNRIPDFWSHRDLGVLVDSSIKFHMHINEIARKPSGVPYSILKGTVCRSSVFMKKVYISHITPIIDFG